MQRMTTTLATLDPSELGWWKMHGVKFIFIIEMETMREAHDVEVFYQ